MFGRFYKTAKNGKNTNVRQGQKGQIFDNTNIRHGKYQKCKCSKIQKFDRDNYSTIQNIRNTDGQNINVRKYKFATGTNILQYECSMIQFFFSTLYKVFRQYQVSLKQTFENKVTSIMLDFDLAL